MPDEGTISVDGVPIRVRSPADAIRAGIGMVQQHFALVPAMTARENIALGLSSGRRLQVDAHRGTAESGSRLDVEIPVRDLTVSEQQRVELMKTLARGARVIILDEPTAALAPRDAEQLFAWLRRFREEGGSAVLITHKLREALAVADFITVLRRGRVTWSGRRDDADMDMLITAMMGAPHSLATARAAPRQADASTSHDEPVVRAEGMMIRDVRGAAIVREVSLRIQRGEILGVAGVAGSGAREFLHAVAGRLRPSSGTLQLPNDIGFIPEDRQHEALLMDESVAANVALHEAGKRRGWLGRRAMEAAAERLVRDNEIQASDVRASVSTLSGGNQQRLIAARELADRPSLLVAVNPTRGLDVVATASIQQQLRDAASAGMAIVYYTADLDELIDIADRVVVLFDGRVREVARDRDVVGRAMLGAA
jgi:simple sugar transport system ATP-binding protein